MEEVVNKFLDLEFQGQSKLYKFEDAPGDDNFLFYSLYKNQFSSQQNHIQLCQKYLRDMESYKIKNTILYGAFARVVNKKHGSTLNLRLETIANRPSSWEIWIEASAMMLKWNLDIIFNTQGRINQNELIYMVTNCKDALVEVLPPVSITGP